MNPQVTIKKISFHLSRRDTVGALAEASALVEFNPADSCGDICIIQSLVVFIRIFVYERAHQREGTGKFRAQL